MLAPVRLGPKLPCPVCGGRDVDIVAARQVDGGQPHEMVTVHGNGDECHHRTRTIVFATALGAAARYARGVEANRCTSCRKLLSSEEALGRHQAACPGAAAADVGDPAIALPAGQGVYCWACGRHRATVWLEPDLCCRTCKAVLLTVGELDG
jgi:hypothetical protein